MLLQVKQQKVTSKKRRCDIHMYGEALTSDEVLERIEEKETQKKKRGRKKGRAARQETTDDEGTLCIPYSAAFTNVIQ